MGRTGLIDAVRAAGENDADRGKGFYLFQGRAEGLDFAIDVALTDAAGDKLVILSAEVENKYLLIFMQNLRSFLTNTLYILIRPFARANEKSVILLT